MMVNLEEQEANIESMRTRLHDLVIAKGANMIDPEVSELSTKLDKLIVNYEREKAKLKCGK